MSKSWAVTVPTTTEPRSNSPTSSTRGADRGRGGQGCPRVRQYGFARGGQPDRTAAAIEQLLAEFALQVADLSAHRWLRDVHPLGGAGEVGFFGHRDEVFELPQVHK